MLLLVLSSAEQMLLYLRQPWHWSISGLLIAVVMFLLLWAGGGFGVSSTFRSLCTIGGAGRLATYFRFDWRSQSWNLAFILGAILGGIIGATWLASPDPVAISEATVADLATLGFAAPTATLHSGLLPPELFSIAALGRLFPWVLMLGGGFLIGFGTRWAGGCTSGHAISGLANLQWPSLLAVIGFFAGGLLMTHLFFPILFS